MRKLTTVLALVTLLSSVLFPSLRTHAQAAAAQSVSTKTLKVSGLRDTVTVRRDERGIPYIEAKNDEDLYFAQGYITASDRLWQMDVFRRNARGELAEFLAKAVHAEDQPNRSSS